MNNPNRGHLVRTVVEDKNGNMVTRYINPNKNEGDYAEHRRAVRAELARHKGNVPPGSGKIRETLKEYQQGRHMISAMNSANEMLKAELRDRIDDGESFDFNDFEDDPAVVTKGKSAMAFNDAEAVRNLSSKEFRQCRSDNLSVRKLRESYPDVYERASRPGDSTKIQLDWESEDTGRDEARQEVWDRIRETTGKNSLDNMSNRELARSLSEMDVRSRRYEKKVSEQLENIQDEFDEGDTYLGDVRVRKYREKEIDWDQAKEELGDRIEACRSDKILVGKVRKLKGNDWAAQFNNKPRAAPIKMEWYQ